MDVHTARDTLSFNQDILISSEDNVSSASLTTSTSLAGATTGVLLLLLLLLLYRLRRPSKLVKMTENIPGPPTFPVFGNALQLGRTPSDYYNVLTRLSKEFYGSPFKLWIGSKLHVYLTKPSDVGVVMNQKTEKGNSYKYMRAAIGEGLLTGSGSHWHRHRKILTPAFHFKILEEFIDIFHANGQIFVEVLKDQVGAPKFDIHHYTIRNLVDNISETSMGIQMKAQQIKDLEYVYAVRNLAVIVVERMMKPWLQMDLFFNFSVQKTMQDKALKILHGTSRGVIKKRREEVANGRTNKGSATTADIDDMGIKRKRNFIDILLGSDLTDEEIREEVDTFMAAGADSTSSAMDYILWNLAWNEDIQEAVVREIQEVCPDLTTVPPTYNQLQDLKLLERVIKEAMRMYTVVPMVSKELSEDVVLSGKQVVPKEAEVMIVSFMVHKDPQVYPDPEKFDPDRFLPDNVQGRNPYAYIPYSAGPRNCIGQKFAMLVMKCTLGQLLCKYRCLPGVASPQLHLAISLSLVSVGGVQLRIQERD